MAQTSAMIGGDGTYSYAKNSTFQRDGFTTAQEVMTKAIVEALDIQTMLSSGSSTRFAITDMGCSVGPNTFFAMQAIIDTVTMKCHAQGLDPKNLEFQVFFNDQTTNDFNTLFASLPDPKNYLVASVPGSFYNRLFPTSSIHIVYSSSSLHWLSRVPEKLEDEKSPAWNKGRIHYTDGPEAVVRAYAEQFEKDINVFLKERAWEMVRGGLIIVLMPGVPDGVLSHEVGIALTFLGSILMDMVGEGVLEQHQVDSFNMPHVYPSGQQMTRLVEKNGCFKIVRMELRNSRPDKKAAIDIKSAIMHLRAFTEASIKSQMGHKIVEQLFTRAIQQKDKFAHMLYSAGIEIGCQLFTVLQLK